MIANEYKENMPTHQQSEFYLSTLFESLDRWACIDKTEARLVFLIKQEDKYHIGRNLLWTAAKADMEKSERSGNMVFATAVIEENERNSYREIIFKYK